MALQQSILAADTLVGENFPESYVKVEFVRAWKGDSLIWVNWYANGAARADLKQPVKQKEYTASTAALVGANIIAASYEWLKALPEFAGAIDVFVTPEPTVPPAPSPDPLVDLHDVQPTQPADGSVN